MDPSVVASYAWVRNRAVPMQIPWNGNVLTDLLSSFTSNRFFPYFLGHEQGRPQLDFYLFEFDQRSFLIQGRGDETYHLIEFSMASGVPVAVNGVYWGATRKSFGELESDEFNSDLAVSGMITEILRVQGLGGDYQSN
tara:strand:- start:14 stop:427 length:414 start_codon:yes stop_codon:yes gene_type:complete